MGRFRELERDQAGRSSQTNLVLLVLLALQALQVLPVLRARHPLALPTIHIPSHLMPLPNNLCPVRARRKMHIRPVRVLQWRSRQP